MYTKQEIIIKKYREGKSQRTIARELQINRKTVCKYLEAYDAKLRCSKNKEESIAEYLSTSPKYKSRKIGKIKLTQDVQETIDLLLEENKKKEISGLRKQQLKKCDILEQLHLKGFDIGYTTVCNYIRSKESKQNGKKEAFIRQTYSPGEICEFDWGEIKLEIKGKQERFQLAVFTSAYSNYRYAAIFKRQDTIAFMEAHALFFNKTQGVFLQMVYDNMRVAVAKFVGKTEKKPTQSLLQLRSHYQFTHRFCNAYRGNEKGHVERSVEYVRRKAFGLNYKFDDIEKAQEYLEVILNRLNSKTQKQTGQTANQLFSEEKTSLAKLPKTPITCSEQVQLRVDKYATICFRTNRYSVPDHLVGKFLDVHLLSNEIHIYDENKKIATHKRHYGKHQWIIAIEHYLNTFKQKPGAIPGSVALASCTYLKKLYVDYFQDEPRKFIELLDYCYKNQITGEKLEKSVSRLLKNLYGEITTEKLKALLGNSEEQPINYNNDTIVQTSKEQLQEISLLIN